MSSDLSPLQVSDVSRRRFLKTAAVGAGAIAVPATLGACSPDAEGPDTEGNPEAPKGIEDVEQIQLGPETEGVLYPEDYVGPRASKKEPFHDGSKTFKVVVQQDAITVGDWDKNEFTKWLEERTGLKVEYQAILVTGPDGSVDLTKVNAMLASGELPDAFLNIPFSNDQISLYGSQGVFVALDDYIETYAPEMRRMMTEYPDFRDISAAKDGKLYQFRSINDCFHCSISPRRALINKKYVDEVGGKIPETTEELRTLLKLFKDKDPSPKGNILPFVAGVNNPVDGWIMNSFIYNPGGTTDTGWLQVDNDKIKFVANTPEWREGLRFMRSLFDDGIFGREVFTMTDEEVVRAGNQGRIGMIRTTYWGTFIDIVYKDGAAWKDYVTLPPLKGPAGVQYAAWDHYLYTSSQRLIVTSKCENPELLVQWGDYQLELEAINRAYAGIEGEGWRWAKEGEVGINGKQAVFYQANDVKPEGKVWSQNSVMYRSSDYRLGQALDPKSPNFEGDLYEATKPYEPFAEPKEMQVPPMVFDESAAAQKADTAVSIDSHVKQSFAKFAVGELDINDDAAWDEYTQKFEAMGLPAYLELYQQTYDARPQ